MSAVFFLQNNIKLVYILERKNIYVVLLILNV